MGTEKHCIYGGTERASSHDWKTSFQASWGPARVTWGTSPSSVFGSTSSESLPRLPYAAPVKGAPEDHPWWQNLSEGHSHCPAPALPGRQSSGQAAQGRRLVTDAEPSAGLGSALLLLWAGLGVLPPSHASLCLHHGGLCLSPQPGLHSTNCSSLMEI